MKGILIHPPLADPSIAPLGMSYLAADLERVHADYSICDLNLDFIDFVERMGAQGAARPTSSRPPTASSYLEQWRWTCRAFEDASRCFAGFSIKPFELLPHAGDLDAIVEVATNPEGPLFAWLDRTAAAQAMASENPDWVGLSVSFFGQLPAALAIAAWLGQRSTATRIAGGALFRDLPQALLPGSSLWQHFDGIVDGSGEGALSSLELDHGGRLRPRGAQPCGGKWRWSAPSLALPPEPCFDRFPLHAYRAANIVLPYRVFPTCAWGRCTFCADAKYCGHLPVAGGNPEVVATNLQVLARRHHAAGFVFLDAALPAGFMESLARRLSVSTDEPFVWGANARFEPLLANPDVVGMLRAGGCRLLRMGLESAAPRVLRNMRKGIAVETASHVLKATHAAGLVNHLYLMRGFPGESKDERLITLRFLADHADEVDMFSMSDFRVYDGAPIAGDLGHQPRPAQESSEEGWDSEEHLISEFLGRKGGTRCMPTTADTILLGSDLWLDYSTAVPPASGSGTS